MKGELANNAVAIGCSASAIAFSGPCQLRKKNRDSPALLPSGTSSPTPQSPGGCNCHNILATPAF